MEKDIWVGCCDWRDDIQTEYWEYGVGWIPNCSYYTLNGGELNTGDHAWAVVRTVLPGAVASWRSEYGSPLTVSSGYRCPKRNNQVGGESTSRHMFGDACDMDNPNNDVETWCDMWWAAYNCTPQPDFIEPLQKSGLGHVHADWRYAGGGYVP